MIAGMAETGDFAALLERVRAGDEGAAAELVRRFEPEVRQAVRRKLTDRKLRQVLDSMDVCQSVYLNFFLRATAGEFELAGPEDLVRLLVTMARNRVVDHARKQQAGIRDKGRERPLDTQAQGVASPGPSPSRVVAGREILDRVRSLFTEEERRLADLRAQGRSWAEMAAELGGTPDGLRMKLSRAVDRISREMSLDA